MESTDDSNKTTKDCLIHVLRKSHLPPQTIVAIIENAVIRTNSVVTHGLRFLKLFCLHCRAQGQPLPMLDSVFILNCFRAVMGTSASRSFKHADVRQTLLDFFHTHYRRHIHADDDILLANMRGHSNPYSNLTQILLYESTKAVAQIENNVVMHYADYVEAFIRAVFDVKAEIARLKERRDVQGIKALRKLVRDQKAAVLARNISKIHSSVIPHYASIMPDVLQNPKAVGKPLTYDLKSRPNAFFKSMVYMMAIVEQAGGRLLNIFPARRSGIPSYIRLDTKSVIEHLVDRKQHFASLDLPSTIKHKLHLKCNSSEHAAKIWALFFKTNTSKFRHADPYVFANMIETDGVGVSIIMERRRVGKKKYGFRTPKKKVATDAYVDDVCPSEVSCEKTVVGIDPGKNNIITAVSCPSNDFDACSPHTTRKTRYSAVGRRKDMKQTKLRRRIRRLRRSFCVEGQTVEQIETLLSEHNASTLCFDKYAAYCSVKNRVDTLLRDFYRADHFRLSKLHTYSNRRRSEEKMMAAFEKTHGGPDTTVVAFGDFEQREHMKHKPPTAGVGIRKLFRKHGYTTVLVDEFRTSARCFKCASDSGVNEKFLRVADPRPFKVKMKKNNGDADECVPRTRMSHAVLRCQTCNTVWNRDVCGALNIGRVAAAHLRGDGRPLYLRRGSADPCDDVVAHGASKKRRYGPATNLPQKKKARLSSLS